MADNCGACSSSYNQGNITKRLIVCCDGTGSGVDKGTADFASNVARLSRAISRVGSTRKGEKIAQVVYYQSGVGTGSLTQLDKARQTAFGASLAENVCEAYNYLVNNWGPGDEIFIFGFSRGAYTARSLAGFICQVGLLQPIHMDGFFDVYNAYRNRGDKTFAESDWAKASLIPGELGSVPTVEGQEPHKFGPRIDHIRSIAHTHVKIKVCGVWDTVGSLGVTNWYGPAGEDNFFHSTKLSPKIENAFHALALDENRGNFPPTLWHLDSSCMEEDGKTPKVNLKQVWFPGYHSDVGGHSKGRLDTNSVDEIAFAWMVDQLNGLLQLSGTVLSKYILYRLGDTKYDTSHKEVRDFAAAWGQVKWSDGHLDNTNEWLDWWWVPSLVSTKKMSFYRVPGQTKSYEKVNGEKREIPHERLCEEIHPSVFHRAETWRGKNNERYTPTPFAKGWEHVDAAPGQRAQWVKTLPNGEDIVLNEYLIPKHETLKGVQTRLTGYDHWEGSLERQFAPKEILENQDTLL